MVKQQSTVPIVVSILLASAPSSSGAFGVSSINDRNTPTKRISSTLNIASIDAAELLDSSFFGVGDAIVDDCFAKNKSIEANSEIGVTQRVVCSTPHTTSSIKKDAIERITSSNLAWAAIAAILSLSTALNTQAIRTSLQLLTAFSSWYMTRLEVAPLLTKCVTGGLVALIGDYGAQWFEYKQRKPKSMVASTPGDSALAIRAGSNGTAIPMRKRDRMSVHGTYNFRRGMARFLECLLISSPLMHYGYDIFESIIPVVGGSGIYRSLAALSHVIADCLFLDGIFVGTGILATGLFEGKSIRNALVSLRNVYFPTLKASILTSGALVPLQFLSFRFLPVQLRVLSVNAVDLIWNGVVSFVSHESGDVEKAHA